MQPSRITIGRISIDPVTRAEAITAVEALVRAGRGGFVVTPNIDHIVLAHHDPRLRDAYARASLSLPDGQPVVWMSRLLGTMAPERVSGSDLIWPLMATAAARAWKVFFFGTTASVSGEAERRLIALNPGLRVVGRDCSFWSADDPTEPDASGVVRAIRESGAELVIVSLSAPRQEIWMARHARAIAPAVAIGMGAALDFVAGAVVRAPAWVSNAGLEWLYRLAQEPRRLAHRYLVRGPQILPIFAGTFYRRFLARGPGRARPLDESAQAVHKES